VGWKASCIFASPRDDGYLKSFPPHRPEKAKQLLSLLGGRYKSAGMATLEQGVNPRGRKHLYLGVYDEAVVIGNHGLVDHSFDGNVPQIVEHLNFFLPRSQVLVITLHSVVNLFGYAWFDQGRLVRGRAGSADDGVFFEEGNPLALESNLLSKSAMRNGERVYLVDVGGVQEEFDESSFGEEFVMELCRPFLGCRLDQFDVWNLKMEHLVRSIIPKLPWG
jgi:hypothetical protein